MEDASHAPQGARQTLTIPWLHVTYAGCAQMANLVCRWIQDADAPYAPPGAAAAGNSSALDPAAPLSNILGASSSAETPDAFTFLQVWSCAALWSSVRLQRTRALVGGQLRGGGSGRIAHLCMGAWLG